MTRVLLLIFVLGACADASDDEVTLRISAGWSSEQDAAIRQACADASPDLRAGCRVTADGDVAVSRSSTSFKRVLADLEPGRRRIVVPDEVNRPADIERNVRAQIMDLTE